MWWERVFRRGEEIDPPATTAEALDERLNAYLDGDWDATDTPLVQSQIADDPETRSAYEGLRLVRDALSELGEVRAPRPFTLVAAPAPAPVRPSWLELATRAGAAVSALLLAVVLVGDVVSTGGDGAVPSEARPAALKELSAVTAEADFAESGAAAPAAPAAPTVAALAAPAAPASGDDGEREAPTTESAAGDAPEESAPAPASSPGTTEAAPVEGARMPAPAPAPAGMPDDDSAADQGDRAVSGLELALGVAAVVFGAAAVAQWARRRRT